MCKVGSWGRQWNLPSLAFPYYMADMAAAKNEHKTVCYSNSKSKCYQRWLVFGASFLAALISSLI